MTATPFRGCSVYDERRKSLLLKTLSRNGTKHAKHVAVIACIFEAQGE